MDAHTRTTYEAITAGRAPRALEWTRFVHLWQEIADDVEPETGDRLAVHLHGQRVVFHRRHDGVGRVDLSSATDSDLEAAALAVLAET